MDKNHRSDQQPDNAPETELQSRRDFLVGLKKWSKAVIGGVVLGGVLAYADKDADAWVAAGPRGGWANRRGGGGWANRRGGGGWLNGRGYGGGWINRGYGGGWINGGGGWINRGGSWLNRRW